MQEILYGNMLRKDMDQNDRIAASCFLFHPRWPPVLQQQQFNSPCVAGQKASSWLWPLYAKCGISHQLASTDTPVVWGRLMPWRGTLLFSLSLFLGSRVSLPLSLSDSPSGHTINCQPRTSLPLPPLLFPSLALPNARVTDVEEGNTEG